MNRHSFGKILAICALFSLTSFTSSCIATKEYVREEINKSQATKASEYQKKIDELKNQIAIMQSTIEKLNTLQIKHVALINNLEKNQGQLNLQVVKSIQEASKASNDVGNLRKELLSIIDQGQKVIRLTEHLSKIYKDQRGQLLQILELETQTMQNKMRNIDAIKRELRKAKTLDLKK